MYLEKPGREGERDVKREGKSKRYRGRERETHTNTHKTDSDTQKE